MRLDFGLARPAGAGASSTATDLLAPQRRKLLQLVDTLALVLSLPLALETLAALRQLTRAGGDRALLLPQFAALVALWTAGTVLIALRKERAAFGAIFGLGLLVVLLQIGQRGSVVPGAMALPALALAAIALPIGPLLAAIATATSAMLAVCAASNGIGAAEALAAVAVLAAIALAFGALGNRFRAMLQAVAEAGERLEDARISQSRHEQRQRLLEAQQQVLRHDLRSPCDILAGYVELMQHSTLPPEQTAATLQQIKIQALRLRMRIDALVDEAKSPGRRDWDIVELGDLLRRHLKELRYLALAAPRDPAWAAPHVQLDAGERCAMRGRAHELQRIFENLVANSAAAGAANIWIALHSADGSVEISVKDDGPGYPATLIGSTLGPNYAERPPGAGLGLVGVAANVAAFGGTVELTNWQIGADGGACTLLRFPCS